MEEFETSLINLFNASTLPFEAKRYVLKHVSSMVENTYNTELAKLKSEGEQGHDDGGSDNAD